MINNYCHFF